MNTKRYLVILVLIMSGILSGCGSPTPTHWKGETDNGHWSIAFDYLSGKIITNIGIDFNGSSSMACSFQITQISLNTNDSFDYNIADADLKSAVGKSSIGIKGSINGEFTDASTIYGKITITDCGRSSYFNEKDLPWTAKQVQP